MSDPYIQDLEERLATVEGECLLLQEKFTNLLNTLGIPEGHVENAQHVESLDNVIAEDLPDLPAHNIGAAELKEAFFQEYKDGPWPFKVIDHNCSFCQHPVGWVIHEDGSLFYDSGCSCSSSYHAPEPRTWQSAADSINVQSVARHFVYMAALWGLVAVEKIGPRSMEGF
jgi:hypothetical protein